MTFELNFWLNASTNEMSTRLCHKRNASCLFLEQVRKRLIMSDGAISTKKKFCFIFVVTNFLFAKTIRPITVKQHFCRFLVLEMRFQNVAARFAMQPSVTKFILLYPCMDVDTFLSWTNPARTKHISNNNLHWLLCLFKIFYPLVTHQEKKFVCSSKRFLRTWHLDVHWKQWRPFLPRLESPFVHAKFSGTRFVRAVHLPNKLKNAFAIATISIQCAIFRNCSYWTRWHLTSVLVKVVKFATVKVDLFCKID